MKLFLDTAHLSDISAARDWGILDGVTTNPSLAAKEGLESAELIARIYDTQVLAASLRHPVHVVEAARPGRRLRHDALRRHGATVPPSADRHRDGPFQRRLGGVPARSGRQARLSLAERIL